MSGWRSTWCRNCQWTRAAHKDGRAYGGPGWQPCPRFQPKEPSEPRTTIVREMAAAWHERELWRKRDFPLLEEARHYLAALRRIWHAAKEAAE